MRIMRKKVLLPLLAFGTVALIATGANAGQGGQGPKVRDSRAVWADIQSGKAPRVPTPPGREVAHFGVWNGCKFVYLKAYIATYNLPEGGVAEVSERPDPLPPKGPNCVDRDPTAEEIDASRAHTSALNAAGRPAGAPAPPPFPG